MTMRRDAEHLTLAIRSDFSAEAQVESAGSDLDRPAVDRPRF